MRQVEFSSSAMSLLLLELADEASLFSLAMTLLEFWVCEVP
ncbi:hypothetical protein [Streptomyces sviceus]